VASQLFVCETTVKNYCIPEARLRLDILGHIPPNRDIHNIVKPIHFLVLIDSYLNREVASAKLFFSYA